MNSFAKRLRAEDLLEEDDQVEREVDRMISSSPAREVQPAKSGSGWSVSVIKVSSAGISLAASSMSVYYTFQWFYGRLPWFQAMLMTVIIVGSILLIPQMIMLMLSTFTPLSIISSAILALILTVSALFSMMTTVGTLYNAQSATAVQSTRASSITSSRAASLASRETKTKRLEGAIERATADEERYTLEIQKLLDAGVSTGQQMNAMVQSRSTARKIASDSEKQLDAVLFQTESIQEEAISDQPVRHDFITWFAERFGIGRDSMELIMNAVPAVFVDVLAPSMLMVVLFL